MFSGLLLTILTGAFFLIGILALKYTKNSEKISLFAISLAFIVMGGLLFFDLLPEIISYKNILLIIPIIIGFLVLVLLDMLIPHHHHEHHEYKDDKKEHNLHLNHVGTITIIALAIHNFLEGLTLYSVTLNSLSSGILMMLSISLHNIPLGFQIGNSLSKDKKSYLLIFLLFISAFLGALLIIIFGNISNTLISILISLTFGMLLYILLFELLATIKASFKKKAVKYGIIVGVIIIIITFLV